MLNSGKEDVRNQLRKLRIQTWFQAVADASRKNAYQLEAEFSPNYLVGAKFHKGRSRIWAKYQRGESMPTFKEKSGGRKPIALIVEEKYPGTLKWLTHPIWELADPFIDFNMQDLKPIYESLPEKYRSYLIEENHEHPYFWRKQNDDLELMLDVFSEDKSVDDLTALICLYRESVICLNISKFRNIRKKLIEFSRYRSFSFVNYLISFKS